MLIAALLAAAATAPAPPPAQESDIIVLANKLKQWNGRFSVKGTKVTCKTILSTGDREIDAIGCQAFETCVPRLRSQIDATDARGLDKDLRARMKEDVKRDLGACVMAERQRLIELLADKRAAAG